MEAGTMFRLVKTVKRPRFRPRRCAVLVAAVGLVAVFVAGAAGAAHSSFVPSAVVAAGSHVIDVAVADFNGDGTPDLAVASASYRSNDVSILLGDGAGSFRPAPGSPVKLPSDPARIMTADFDGDGKVDLAVSRWDWDDGEIDNVSILLGNGAGGLSAAPGAPLELAGLAAVSDLNGDGKSDLVALQLLKQRIAVLLDEGSGRFTPAPGSPFAAGTNPGTIAVA